MKKTILTLFITLFFISHSIAQGTRTATQEIKDAITEEFNKWLVKSDFETNADYEKRVKNEAETRLNEISKECVLRSKFFYLKQYPFSIGKYDAENSFFKLKDKSLRSDKPHQTLNLEVDRSISERFKKIFGNESDHPSFKDVVPIDAEMVNDEWLMTKAFIIFYDGSCDMDTNSYKINQKSQLIFDHFQNKGIRNEKLKMYYTFQELDFKEKTLPDTIYSMNGYTKWDIKTQPNYKPSESKPIAFSLEDLNITLPASLTSSASNTIAKSDEPDLDISKVQTTNSNPNAVAVVIGNKDYENTKKVSFAINDATEIKKYLITVLGYSESNIIYLENAKKSNFDILFGTNELAEGKLFNTIKQGVSDVFIYYSGHGAPGLKDNKGYFVPVDCDPQYLEQTGYSLDLFYKNLAKLNAKSVTVVTDACFSGAELFKNISPITIKVTNPIVLTPNCVVLSSSTGAQVSSWFNDKNHGLFTYFLLRALQDKDNCDTNKDNKLTLKEIADYVSDKTQGVPSLARKLHNVDQNPTIQGTGIENVFIEYK